MRNAGRRRLTIHAITLAMNLFRLSLPWCEGKGTPSYIRRLWRKNPAFGMGDYIGHLVRGRRATAPQLYSARLQRLDSTSGRAAPTLIDETAHRERRFTAAPIAIGWGDPGKL
jgi:hypothetical protein